MKKGLLFLLIAAVLLCQFWGRTALSIDFEDESKILYPIKASVPPKIDGNLDDEVWEQHQPLNKDFVAFEPLYGEVIPQRTMVWMAYDDKNLYFAFRCHDSEPGKIKTSITRRDNIYSDDWIGLSLDSLGNRQSAYGFFINPNGIQADGLYLASESQHYSSDPDFVWYSAGRLTDDGYQVEMRIPLRSIRFQSSKEVKMGIMFLRGVSRLGINASWPEIKPGFGRFNVLATAVYQELKTPLNLELLPSAVYGRNNDRLTPDKWGETEVFHDIGIGIKYGITASVTADITINPDFSQVESDAFQVEVNQRYPTFYSEKY